MKKFLWGIGVLAVVLIGLLIAIPYFVDANRYKPFIIDAAKRATGRDVAIDGPITLSLFPDIGLGVSKVTLSNLPGEKTPMASVSEMQLEVALMPLLQGGNVKVTKFVLQDPQIYLLVNAAGEKNWQFKLPSKRAEKVVNDSPAAPASIGMIHDVTIKNGTFKYSDKQKKKDIVLEKVNASLALSGSSEPLTLKGSAQWNGKATDVEVKVDNITELFAEPGSKCAMKLSSDVLAASYKGQFSLAKKTSGSGEFEAHSPDVKGLIAWMGNTAAEKSTKQSFDIKTTTVLNDKKLDLTSLLLTLDKFSAKGAIVVNLAGEVPFLQGNLAAEDVDLEPYFAASAEEANKGDALQDASSDWSTDPINVNALRSVNADISITAKSFSIPKLHLGNMAGKVAVQQGRMTVTLNEAGFYGGILTGSLMVDGSGNVPVIKKKFFLKGVDAEKFFGDTFKFKKISGKLDASGDVSAAGKSQKALVSNLNGTGKFSLEEGKIRGIDLISMVRNVTTSFKAGDSGQATEFSSVNGSVVITEGIVRNDDLLIKSALFAAQGAGNADIPRKYLDYRLTPKFGANAKGLAVPVVIKGPFSHLVFAPDVGNIVKDILQDPAKAKEQLKSLEDNIQSIGKGLKLNLH